MRYELPIPARDSLRLYRRNVSGKEYIKVTSLLMHSNGLSVETVSDSSGIDISTVYRYWNRYKELGLDAFLENRHKGYWGRTDKYNRKIQSYKFSKRIAQKKMNINVV